MCLVAPRSSLRGGGWPRRLRVCYTGKKEGRCLALLNSPPTLAREGGGGSPSRLRVKSEDFVLTRLDRLQRYCTDTP